jgi:adenosine kinase
MDRDLGTAARMGAVAATYAIEKYGTQEHYYTYEDFAERYRKNFGAL